MIVNEASELIFITIAFFFFEIYSFKNENVNLHNDGKLNKIVSVWEIIILRKSKVMMIIS